MNCRHYFLIYKRLNVNVSRATLCSFYSYSNNLGDLGMGNHPLDSRERQSPDFKKGLLWQI